MDEQRNAIELCARRRIVHVAVVILLAGLVAPNPALGQMVTGTYNGDGNDDRAFTGVGFEPDVVIIKRYPNKNAVICTSTMTVGESKKFTGSGMLSNLIQSLDTDGFTIGNDQFVNQSGGSPYHWIAFKAAAGSLKVDTYTGDNVADRSITGVGFQPNYLIVLSEGGQHPYHRSSAMDAGDCAKMEGSGLSTGIIQAFETDGFQVGNNSAVNGNSTVYHYVAWKAVAGSLEVGSYAGDSSDDRDIAVSFQPKWVIVQASASVSLGDGSPGTIHRPDTMTGDVSINFNWAYSSTLFDNCIQALQTTGFQVGTNQTVNQSGKTYYWMAFGGDRYGMATGTYTGDGQSSQSITGVGFRPDVLFVKGADGSQDSMIRMSTMTGDASKRFNNSGLLTNNIESLDADGFTVGSDAKVNNSGTAYYWTAYKAYQGALTLGTYPGNGTADHSIAGVGFQPDLVMVTGDDTSSIFFKTSPMPAGGCMRVGTIGILNNKITGFESDGFKVGADPILNNVGVTYHYAAWKGIAGQTAVGTYTGDGVDDHTIAAIGFAPEYVFIKQDGSEKAVHRSASLVGDSTLSLVANAAFTGGIKSLTADGFQLGVDDRVNKSSETYYWAAFNDSTVSTPTLTLADHDTGQESDAFTQSGSETDAELFGFNLDAGGDTIAVTELVFRLTNISGLTDCDWRFGEIVVDDDGDGDIDIGETTTVGGVETVDQAAGTITFPLSFNVSTATNYILRMDFSDLSDGDAVTIDLDSADITTTYDVSGSTTAVTHSEVTPAAGGDMATGTYTGNGTSQSITGVGFQPDVVIIKGDTNKNAFLRSSTMPGLLSKSLVGNPSLQSGRIESLDTDGFTVGSNAEVNEGSTAYYWVAFKEAAGQLDVGTYSGNSSDDHNISGVGFQPDYLIVLSEGTHNVLHHSSTMPADFSVRFSEQNLFTDRIQEFQSDGFQVGTHNQVNMSSTTYHYVAFKESAGQMKVGSYPGDDASAHNITGVGFQPAYLILKAEGYNAAHRMTSVTGDSTLDFKTVANYADGIKELQTDGFQLGTHAKVNQSGKTYYWMAFANAPPSSSPRLIRWVEVDPYYP